MKRLIELIMKYKPPIILILVPIGFTLLFGAAMSPIFVDDIPIAILDLDQSEQSREIIRDFEACNVFDITEYAESSEQIKEEILLGKIKGALILPAGFEADVAGRKGAKALMLMDGSNFLVGNNLMLYANKIFTAKNTELQVADLEAGGMLPAVSEDAINTLTLADRALYNPQLGYFYYLYPGLLGVFVQQTYLNVIAPILLKEKQRLKRMPLDRIARKIRPKEMAPLIVQYAAMTFVGALACMLIVHGLFAYPLNGNLALTLLIQVLFLAGLTGVAFVLAAIFDDVTHCTQFVMFLAIPSMLSCGYGWPEFMMAPGFAKVMKAVWPLYYYANPLKELMLKGAGFESIAPFIIGGALFAAFWMPAGMWIYRQKIRTMKQIEEEVQNNIERG
jgi:ABC-2 type transport system permease protein